MGIGNFLFRTFNGAATVKQAIKFALVGATNTAVSLATIFILSSIPGASYKLANAVGYVVGLINSFILNRIWTFQSTDTVAPQFLRFVAVFLLCYATQYGILVTLVERGNVDTRLSQVVSMIFYTGISFVLGKILVFRRTRRK